MRVWNLPNALRRRSIIGAVIRHFEVLLILGLVAVASVRYYVDLQTQSFEEMQVSGEIRVLISDEPDSVFLFNRQHYGFGYELLRRFAEQNGLRLNLQIVPYAELFARLDSGAGDIAVGGILDNPYVRRVSAPTMAWYEAQTTVVYRRGTKRPLTVEELEMQPVLASARYFQLPGFEGLNLKDDFRSEYRLLNAVTTGEARYALTTNYRAKSAKHYLPELNRSFVLPDKVDLVWALPKRHDESFMAALNEFLINALEANLPEQLAEEYLTLPKRLSTYDALYLHRKITTTLPKFEFAFRKAARKAGIDWTLLAAIAYQESRWSNSARSPTGVRGIMQLTTTTAESLGVTDRLDMSQTIAAAAGYLVELRRRLPDKITEPQRTWFAVGAYNMGLRHVLRGIRRADKEELNSVEWEEVSKVLIRLYDEEFSQGLQARAYVERVQIFTDILRFYDLHQRDRILLDPAVFAGPDSIITGL